MTPTLVIDASIAIKWVIEENGSSEAVALRVAHRFVAPDLLNAECANILWKKVSVVSSYRMKPALPRTC